MDFNVVRARPYGPCDDGHLYPNLDRSTKRLLLEQADGPSPTILPLMGLNIYRHTGMNGAQWTGVAELSELEMEITDARVGFRVKKMHSSGWGIGPIGMLFWAGSAMRARSKNNRGTIAGHLRYEWLRNVGFNSGRMGSTIWLDAPIISGQLVRAEAVLSFRHDAEAHARNIFDKAVAERLRSQDHDAVQLDLDRAQAFHNRPNAVIGGPRPIGSPRVPQG